MSSCTTREQDELVRRKVKQQNLPFFKKKMKQFPSCAFSARVNLKRDVHFRRSTWKALSTLRRKAAIPRSLMAAEAVNL
jgi:hypothetical protein